MNVKNHSLDNTSTKTPNTNMERQYFNIEKAKKHITSDDTKKILRRIIDQTRVDESESTGLLIFRRLFDTVRKIGMADTVHGLSIEELVKKMPYYLKYAKRILPEVRTELINAILKEMKNLDPDLKEISLDYCYLTEFPAAILEFRKLKKLSLDHNEIGEVPLQIGDLVDLTNLCLHDNEIKEVPPAIERLVNLKTFSLGSNKIRNIPPFIGNLKNLTYLDFSDNELTEVPIAIGKLTDLKYIFLNYNEISELPQSFANLTELEYLFLHETNMKSFPPFVGDFKNLRDCLI